MKVENRYSSLFFHPRVFWRLLVIVFLICGVFIIAKRILLDEPANDLYQVAFDLAPSGQDVVFCSSGESPTGRDLFLLNLKTSKVTRLTDSIDIEKDPAFSPDGRSIVYSARHRGHFESLFVFSKNTGASRQITQDSYSDSTPSFSPDGATVVFSRAYEFSLGGLAPAGWINHDLHTVDINGSGLRRITWEKLRDLEGIHYSPSGTFIAYAVPRPRIKFNVSLLKINAHNSRILWSKQLYDNPVILDDLKMLATRYETIYSNSRAFISLIKTDGTLIRDIMPVPIGIRNPALTSDQKYLYFLLLTNKGKGPELWKADLRKKSLNIVANHKLFDNPLTWTP